MTDLQELFENQAVSTLAESHQVFTPLAAQLSYVRQRKRELRGAYCYVDLIYKDDARPIAFQDSYLFAGAMTGECEGMTDGFFVDFLFEGGFLTRIEGSANGETWNIRSSPRLAIHPVPPFRHLDLYLSGYGK